jgi:hypothetical protein
MSIINTSVKKVCANIGFQLWTVYCSTFTEMVHTDTALPPPARDNQPFGTGHWSGVDRIIGSSCTVNPFISDWYIRTETDRHTYAHATYRDEQRVRHRARNVGSGDFRNDTRAFGDSAVVQRMSRNDEILSAALHRRIFR